MRRRDFLRAGAMGALGPGLAEGDLFEGRDLEVTTDYRTLAGEILERHLGNARVEDVFPGFSYGPGSRLGVIA